MDKGEIDDDEEQMFVDLWKEMLASKTPIETRFGPQKDVYVPNGNTIMFKMFAQAKTIHICVSKEVRWLVWLDHYTNVEFWNCLEDHTIHIWFRRLPYVRNNKP